jgi:hypothetical protein
MNALKLKASGKSKLIKGCISAWMSITVDHHVSHCHILRQHVRCIVNFINHDDYDKKTGLREMSHPEFHIPSRKMSSV